MENPKKFPLCSIDAPCGTEVDSSIAKFVGIAAAPGGGGAWSTVGLYAAEPV